MEKKSATSTVALKTLMCRAEIMVVVPLVQGLGATNKLNGLGILRESMMDDLENWIEIDEAKARAKKKENIKLHKEAQSLLAMYRKELNKTFASMRSDFKPVPSKCDQDER